jgi:UDP-N-acetylglucosamine--N-acetylmuramyl-(pentapeptide) pyrophosphoryl-undecaprenol N-acetylglucosamine transferase
MNDRRGLRIVMAGGGTGGHLFPGIAVAREAIARDPLVTVTFAGTARGLEVRVVPREGFALDLVRSGGLKGKSIGAVARGLGMLGPSAVDAWRLLTRRAPHVVVGLGGYSSGPVVALAACRGIPTLLMEQNAVPGLTNRLLGRIVRAAAVTYRRTLPFFGAKGILSGNPVRTAFFAIAAAQEATEQRVPHVLVFGGSQGAHAINEALMAAAPLLARATMRMTLTHQTGERDRERVRNAYDAVHLEADVEPFVFDMDRQMARADVIVCRAGATTLAEIAAAGRAAVLIPLPTATDDHQRKNAAVFVEAGAAEVIDERDLTGPVLAERLLALGTDANRRRRMSAAARTLARPDAARVIVDCIFSLAGSAREAA